MVHRGKAAISPTNAASMLSGAVIRKPPARKKEEASMKQGPIATLLPFNAIAQNTGSARGQLVLKDI